MHMLRGRRLQNLRGIAVWYVCLANVQRKVFYGLHERFFAAGSTISVKYLRGYRELESSKRIGIEMSKFSFVRRKNAVVLVVKKMDRQKFIVIYFAPEEEQLIIFTLDEGLLCLMNAILMIIWR